MDIKNTRGEVIHTIAGDTLVGADLAGAYLRDANLTGADLSGADLAGADLFRAILTGANLASANLSGADLTDADLSAVNLSFSIVCEASLTGANLTGANLSDAKLRGSRIYSAIGNNEEVRTLQLGGLLAVFTATDMAIGDLQHSIVDWRKFTDEKISAMSEGALGGWAKYLTAIFMIIDV